MRERNHGSLGFCETGEKAMKGISLPLSCPTVRSSRQWWWWHDATMDEMRMTLVWSDVWRAWLSSNVTQSEKRFRSGADDAERRTRSKKEKVEEWKRVQIFILSYWLTIQELWCVWPNELIVKILYSSRVSLFYCYSYTVLGMRRGQWVAGYLEGTNFNLCNGKNKKTANSKIVS